MEIIISGENKEALKLLEKLSKQLGLIVRRVSTKEEKDEDLERSRRLVELMDEMAASGGLQSIKDPVAWQKEVRKDKKLYGRD